ncbi:MAG: hypothetical protein C5B47_01565 [Verrucomicrobia bacterium]|nr:MAG: hypothetical protein C5B47_01565 [Verrucomicrobiota bacterium]
MAGKVTSGPNVSHGRGVSSTKPKNSKIAGSNARFVSGQGASRRANCSTPNQGIAKTLLIVATALSAARIVGSHPGTNRRGETGSAMQPSALAGEDYNDVEYLTSQEIHPNAPGIGNPKSSEGSSESSISLPLPPSTEWASLVHADRTKFHTLSGNQEFLPLIPNEHLEPQNFPKYLAKNFVRSGDANQFSTGFQNDLRKAGEYSQKAVLSLQQEILKTLQQQIESTEEVEETLKEQDGASREIQTSNEQPGASKGTQTSNEQPDTSNDLQTFDEQPDVKPPWKEKLEAAFPLQLAKVKTANTRLRDIVEFEKYAPSGFPSNMGAVHKAESRCSQHLLKSLTLLDEYQQMLAQGAREVVPGLKEEMKKWGREIDKKQREIGTLKGQFGKNHPAIRAARQELQALEEEFNRTRENYGRATQPGTIDGMKADLKRLIVEIEEQMKLIPQFEHIQQPSPTRKEQGSFIRDVKRQIEKMMQ